MDDQARGGPRPGGDNEPAGLSPVRAFLLLGALLAAIFAGFLATREATPATETIAPARSPDYSLTDAEALAEFERLRSAALSAVRNRDVTLLEEVFTTGGPLYERAAQEIDALVEEDVVDRSTFSSVGIEILRNGPAEITIRERSRLEPCFRSSAGGDVSRGPSAIFQIADWTLVLEGQRWLLEDAVIFKDRVLSREERPCD